jgi:hypothetical protein
MKKIKFEKPFASFTLSPEHYHIPLKERWRVALHDPAYLIIWGCFFLLIIIALSSSCNRRSCPTYDGKNTSGQYSNMRSEKNN